MIPIAICTVARPRPYLYATLSSMQASDAQDTDIYLCVGSPDHDYAAPHVSRRVHLHPLVPEEWATIQDGTLAQKSNWNYRRCLSFASDQGLIVLEDDVLVRPDWMHCLAKTVEEMRRHSLAGYALSLYYPQNVKLIRRGTYYQSYLAHTFYGSQAVYYPPGQAETACQWLTNHHNRNIDMALREWFIKAQNVYAPIKSLAQHLGFTTTGLAQHMHRSPNFHHYWPA
jgi:hypothetical protein